MTSKKIVIYVCCVLTLLSFSETAYAGDPVRTSGDDLQLALPAAALGLTFAFGTSGEFGDSAGRYQYLKAGLTCLALTQGLKFAIDEQRSNGHGSQSFPSGHTSAAFFGASFIQRRYGWEYGVPAYLLASFVGYSRVECNAHYIHDVLAGAAIGVLSTYLFTTPISKNISVAPVVGKDSIGFGFVYKW